MLKRILKTTAFIGVFALMLGMAGAAQAFPSGDNPSDHPGDNTVQWTGQGAHDGNGVLDTEECPSGDPVPTGIDPNSYLHWIFTTDGGSASGATLHLGTTAGGNDLGDFSADKASGNAFHFFTPYYTPDKTALFAYVDFTVGETGNGSWNLVISHGCPGEQAKDLTIKKGATPSFTRTFGWTIDKSADKDTVYSAGGGESGSVKYTIAVTKTTTDSGWIVSNTITVGNPNSADVIGVVVTDTIDNNGTCTVQNGSPGVVDPSNATIPANGEVDFPYSCTFTSNPGTGTNTATATWPDIGSPNTSASATAGYTFGDPTTVVGPEEIDVTDTNGGSWHFTGSGSVSYDETFTDPAGTCTEHENTATITQTGQYDSVTVKDCQGADLTVEKIATPTFDRAYTWKIDKSVDKKYIEIQTAGGTATFSYTVKATHDAGIDSNIKVTGTITVSNPNDWEDISANVTDVIPGGNCTVTGGTGVVIPASDSVTLDYSCTFATNPGSGTNTATAKWDADAAHTPNGSATGSADFLFGNPTNVTDECVTVKDTFNGGAANTLGEACVGGAFTKDAGNTLANFASSYVAPTFTFTYSRTVPAPSLGSCVEYPNTAEFKTNDTGTTGSDSESVKVCRFNAPLTIGYWKTHLGKSSNPNDCQGLSLPTGTGCSNNGPWTKYLLGTSICSNGCTAGKLGNFTVTTIQQAAYVFNANNCSNAPTTDANAAACLAAQLLGAELNVANKANLCICSTIKDANKLLAAVGYTVSANGTVSANFTGSGYTRADAIALKTALDNYNNNKGCPPAPPV